MRPKHTILFLPTLILALALAGCADMRTGPAGGQTGPTQSLVIVPAPVPPDGYTAGTATHLVFVLVPDSDPAVKGIELKRGDTLSVALPATFKRNDRVRLQEDSDFNLTLNKGWPQAAVKQAGQYKIFFDERTNTIGVRAEKDVAAEGANSPGAKRIHLRGETFMNPAAGAYPVEVRLAAGDGTVKQTWKGAIQILSAPTAARLAPTNFHLGPGMNGDFQKAGVDQDAPLLLGVLLWDQLGHPLNGVASLRPTAPASPNTQAVCSYNTPGATRRPIPPMIAWSAGSLAPPRQEPQAKRPPARLVAMANRSCPGKWSAMRHFLRRKAAASRIPD
ncbi:hypothetical protein AU476_14865 [Cupriavidus sp. UYMSc13B]|nr:hypothetical protein AU476_14865 [Cupriavidus sp. UYMSc13B]